MFNREIPLRALTGRPSSSAYAPLDTDQPDDHGIPPDNSSQMSPRAGSSKLFAPSRSKRKGKYTDEPEDEVDLLRASSDDERDYDGQTSSASGGNAISMEEGRPVPSLPMSQSLTADSFVLYSPVQEPSGEQRALHRLQSARTSREPFLSGHQVCPHWPTIWIRLTILYIQTNCKLDFRPTLYEIKNTTSQHSSPSYFMSNSSSSSTCIFSLSHYHNSFLL